MQYFNALAWLMLSMASLTTSAQAFQESRHSNHIQLIESAIKRFESTPRQKIAFEVSRYENEEGDISREVERYDPREQSGNRWQLILIDGETPNDKQKKKYRKKREKLKQDKQSISIRLSELFQLNTFKLLAENESEFTAQFTVNTKPLGLDAPDKLVGQLKYSRSNNYISEITITNIAPFSPLFSAEIEHLDVTLEFSLVNNFVVLHKEELVMKGTFAFFTDIDEVSIAQYSDYQLVL